jgi:hypothetical protein
MLDIRLYLFPVVAYCVDTDLNISEKAFESEFNKRYGDKEDEQKAAAALAAAEQQVHWMQLNRITLSQSIIDPINQMITISK